MLLFVRDNRGIGIVVYFDTAEICHYYKVYLHSVVVRGVYFI